MDTQNNKNNAPKGVARKPAMSSMNFAKDNVIASNSLNNNINNIVNNNLNNNNSLKNKRVKSKSSVGTKSMRSLRQNSSSSESQPPTSTSSVGFLARPKSISSLASVCRVATSGRFTSMNSEDLTHEKLGVLNKYGQNLYDTIVIFLTCPFHKKVAVTHLLDRGLFLPHGTIRSGQSWSNACLSLINKILPSVTAQTRSLYLKDPQLIDQLRVQVPIYLDFVTRVTYNAQLTKEGCAKKYCEDTALLQWHFVETILEDTKLNILGPEPEMLYNIKFQCREITFFNVLGVLLEKSPTSLSELINSLNYKDADLIKIYSDFLQHTFPSEYMSQPSFQDYFKKLDYQFDPSVEWPKLFSFFTNEKQNFLNFHDFLMGLAMLDRFKMEPKVPSLGKKEPSVETKKKKSKKSTKVKATSAIPTDFSDSEKFRKYSKWILVSPLAFYKTKQAYPSLDFKRVIADSHKEINKFKFEKLARDSCPRCGKREYSVAQHVLTIQKNECLGCPIMIPQDEINISLENNKAERKVSTRVFLKNFVCNQIVEAIRTFANTQKIYPCLSIDSPELKWDNANDRPKLMSKIRQILTNAKNHYADHARVLINVSSPCYVIGDIHGNLHDLLLYEQTLWKFGMHVSPTNYLFLGDIVDRGNYSIECVLYLICLKLMSPNKVHILRGNHESRSLQREYTFEKECVTKFGEQNGNELFELFNDVFDYWPLAAVLDDSIFCAHGGIPSGATKLEQISTIQLPLRDPEADLLANEILWNDPLSVEEFKALLEEYLIIEKASDTVTSQIGVSASKQFIFNKKRGTANYFSEDALKYFLNINSFSHIIRAHELVQSGYQFMFGGRCITIFSCAKYCEGVNEAAVALVTANKIRIIKVDKNAS